MKIDIKALSAEWCISCTKAKEVLPNYIEGKEDITLSTIDVETEDGKAYMNAFGIRTIPTFIVSVTDKASEVEKELHILSFEGMVKFLKEKVKL